MGSTAEWKGQKKISVNLEKELKLPNLNKRERIEWEKKINRASSIFGTSKKDLRSNIPIIKVLS